MQMIDEMSDETKNGDSQRIIRWLLFIFKPSISPLSDFEDFHLVYS